MWWGGACGGAVEQRGGVCRARLEVILENGLSLGLGHGGRQRVEQHALKLRAGVAHQLAAGRHQRGDALHERARGRGDHARALQERPDQRDALRWRQRLRAKHRGRIAQRSAWRPGINSGCSTTSRHVAPSWVRAAAQRERSARCGCDRAVAGCVGGRREARGPAMREGREGERGLRC